MNRIDIYNKDSEIGQRLCRLDGVVNIDDLFYIEPECWQMPNLFLNFFA